MFLRHLWHSSTYSATYYYSATTLHTDNTRLSSCMSTFFRLTLCHVFLILFFHFFGIDVGRKFLTVGGLVERTVEG